MIKTLQPIDVFNQWSKIEPLINKALKDQFYKAKDIKQSCLDGLTRVYVANDFEAVCTVELKVHPEAKIAVIHTLGGSNMSEWVNELLSEITEDSKKENAEYLQINGRRGWLKQLDGFEEKHTTMMRKI